MTSLGGIGAGIDYPLRRTTFQVDAYAGLGDPLRPAWARAAALIEELLAGTEAHIPVSLTSGYAGVDDIVVRQASAIVEPSRVRNDPQNLARYTLDVELTWS